MYFGTSDVKSSTHLVRFSVRKVERMAISGNEIEQNCELIYLCWGWDWAYCQRLPCPGLPQQYSMMKIVIVVVVFANMMGGGI